MRGKPKPSGMAHILCVWRRVKCEGFVQGRIVNCILAKVYDQAVWSRAYGKRCMVKGIWSRRMVKGV